MWSDEMVILLRHMINDLGTGTQPGEPDTFDYDDSRLQGLIILASQLVQTDVAFDGVYSGDITELTLDPDPTLLDTRDDAFINLTLLKSACIIDNTQARFAAKRAVLMKDNNFTVDNRTTAQAMLAIWKDGWCKHYQDARYTFLAGDIRSVGVAVLGPFRVYAGYYGGPYTPDGNYFGGDLLNYGRYR